MTFSILVSDPDTGTMAAAAATGLLCVGGWVLRGAVNVGMSASQGAAASTLWGDTVLDKMRFGESASEAVANTVAPDSGKEWRQLSAVDRNGTVGLFSGSKNIPVVDSHPIPWGICAGNMLSNENVLPQMAENFKKKTGNLAEKVMAALIAGGKAGGDYRGLQSAALLLLSPDDPPLNLRVDYSETPIDDLEKLFQRSSTGEYYAWTRKVPTYNEPEKAFD